MVHTILVNNDNSITNRMNGAIMEGSTNVDSLRILISPIYTDKFGDLNMIDCTCVMEIITPVGRRYKTKPLIPSEELYKERIEYLLPITLDMTKEAGKLCFKFFFTKLEMNADGSFKERVRETADSYLNIIPVKHWSDYVSDSDLSDVVQGILTLQSRAEHLEVVANKINTTKIDNLEYDKDTNTLTGYADGVEVDRVELEDASECGCEDGVPVVDFTVVEPDEPDKNVVDNVVEF
jgi:hypothetical protein